MPFTYLHLESVDSTNSFLLRKQEEGDIRGLVVSAEEQTAGKGMGTNTWESEPGANLTFSMAVDMAFMKAADQFLLSQAVPLGLLDVLDNFLGLTHHSVPMGMLTVKWPNDIYFDEHKLAGILINSTIKADMMDVSVIGIGLNVNQMRFQDWPTHPISMKMVLGKDVALESLLKQLVNAVDSRIQQLRSSEGVARIKKDYLSRLYRYHQWGDYETKDGIVKLYVDGIDEFGRLITLDDMGNSHIFDIKEIKFL
jgi:BirA family biotin operon repressor/biotin-[acetyl-CoA-carboxylase] ligase